MWGGGVVGRFGIRPHFLQHFLAPFPKWSLRGFLYIFTLSSTNRDCRELHFNTEPLHWSWVGLTCPVIAFSVFCFYIFYLVKFCFVFCRPQLRSSLLWLPSPSPECLKSQCDHLPWGGPERELSEYWFRVSTKTEKVALHQLGLTWRPRSSATALQHFLQPWWVNIPTRDLTYVTLVSEETDETDEDDESYPVIKVIWWKSYLVIKVIWW